MSLGGHGRSLATTDVAIFHLPSGGSQTVRATPRLWTERSAGSNNRRVMRGSEQVSVAGRIQTKLFPSQAKLLLPLTINVTGTQLDLGSYTIDHRILRDDGSGFDYRRYLGCKSSTLDIVCDNTEAGTVVQFGMDVVGSQAATITATDFPEPGWGTAPAYPFEDPFVFQDLSGNVLVGGTALPFFASFNLKVANRLRTPFDDKRYVAQIAWAGRDVTFTCRSRYTTSNWRPILEAQTTETSTATFSDGANSAEFNMYGANYAASVTDDLPFEGEGYYQTLVWDNFFDTTAGTDLLATVLP